MLVKEGTKWAGQDRKIFYVKAVVELEGNVWIHYGEYGTDREYSCYQESFVSRFSPIVN
jgi:hypothetical protein